MSDLSGGARRILQLLDGLLAARDLLSREGREPMGEGFDQPDYFAKLEAKVAENRAAIEATISDMERQHQFLREAVNEYDDKDDPSMAGTLARQQADLAALRRQLDEAMRASGFASVQDYHDDYWRVRRERDEARRFAEEWWGEECPPKIPWEGASAAPPKENA